MTLPILHHCEGARSFRCLWAAEEAGFALDLRTWAFPPRVFAKTFKDVNPLGTIPAWEEQGHLLTESAAICQRIAMGTDLEVRSTVWLTDLEVRPTRRLAKSICAMISRRVVLFLPHCLQPFSGCFPGCART